MRIRTVLAAAAVPAALAASLLATAGAASASTGPAGNGQTSHMTGNKATSYTDPYFGDVQCNETSHPAFDTVSCKSVTGLPLASVTPGQAGSVGWNSDFAGNTRPGTGSLAFTVSLDGMSYSGHATYPAPPAG